MTTEAFTPPPSYVIDGIGPYAVGHEYNEGALTCIINLNGVLTELSSVDFSASPTASETSGNVYLSEAISAAYDMGHLYIIRNTKAEQGWVGVGGAREVSLEKQVDRLSRVVQELQNQMTRTFRVPFNFPTINFFVDDAAERAGRVIICDAEGNPYAGPTGADIENAQPNAAQVALDRAAVEAAFASTFTDFADMSARLPAGLADGTRVQAGYALYDVDSTLPDSDFPNPAGVKLAARPNSGWYITPEMVDAAGDGTGDDHASVMRALEISHKHDVECIMPGTYAVSEPVHLSPLASDARLRGVRRPGEQDTQSAIVAASGFAGSALVIVGDPTGASPMRGGVMEGLRVDASGAGGAHGVASYKTGNMRITDVYCHGAQGAGRGFVIDGAWFPTLERIISRGNSGGGVLLDSTTRESSDGIMIRPAINSNSGFALEFGRRYSQDQRQAKWHIFGGEIGGNISGDAEFASSDGILRIRGADKVQFFGTTFQDTAIDPAEHKLFLLGETGYTPSGTDISSIEAVQFFGCDLQWQGTGAAVQFETGGAPLNSLAFIGGNYRSSKQFIDLSDVTSGIVNLHSIAGLSTSACSDPNRIIRDIQGGAVGLRYGAAEDQFYLESLTDGVPINVRWRTSDGLSSKYVRFGEGAGENLVDFPAGTMPVLRPSTAEPASAVKPALAFADATNWDPLGLGPTVGGYFVWWNGSSWRPLNASGNGAAIL
jgi:hypothetical protein